jgi:uncharacterized repeat protein (TIGR02543 family)
VLPVTAFASYSDIQGHWAKTAIEKWSEKGVIQGSAGKFHPNDQLTRGEMAVILDKVMKYQVTANNSFTDLNETGYTDALLKANAAKIIMGSNGKVRPTDKITREEASVILCKALGISEDKSAKSKKFKDNAKISDWAAGYISALEKKGYIGGDLSGNFNPKNGITRAEIIKILDKTIKGLYNKAGEYSDGVVDGNVIINTPGVTLKNMEIKGTLIISEGVGEGNVNIDNVKISGNTVVKGGGVHSVYFNNVTVGGALVVNKVGGNLRIIASGTTSVSVATLESGVILVTRDLVGGGIEKVEIPASVAAGQNIVLQGNFNNVVNNCPDITIQATGKINNLVLNVESTITGEVEIAKLTTAQGADSVINNKPVSGGQNDITLSNPPANGNTGSGSTGDSGSNGGTNGGSNPGTNPNPVQLYKVTFDTNGGSVVDAVYANNVGIVTLPAPPNKQGFTFVDWYTDVELTHAFNASLPITSDITLCAKWSDGQGTVQRYTVTFDTTGGSVVDAVSANVGGIIILPVPPTKQGSAFLGWYTDVELTHAFNAAVPITSDITLYAKWSGWQEPVYIDSRFAAGYPSTNVNESDSKINLKVKLVGASAENPMEVFMVINQVNSHVNDIDVNAVIHGHGGTRDNLIYVDEAPFIRIIDENEHIIPTNVSVSGEKNIKVYFVIRDSSKTSEACTMLEFMEEVTSELDQHSPFPISAYVNGAGNKISLHFAGVLDTNSIPAVNDFILSNGVAVSSMSISNSIGYGGSLGRVDLQLSESISNITGLELSYQGTALQDKATVPNKVQAFNRKAVDTASLSVGYVDVSNNGQYITLYIKKSVYLNGGNPTLVTLNYGADSAAASTLIEGQDYMKTGSYSSSGSYMEIRIKLFHEPTLTPGNKYFIAVDANGQKDFAGDYIAVINTEGVPTTTPEASLVPESVVLTTAAKTITITFPAGSGFKASSLSACFFKLAVEGKDYILRGYIYESNGAIRLTQQNIPFDMGTADWSTAKISYSPNVHPNTFESSYISFASGKPYDGFSDVLITVN